MAANWIASRIRPITFIGLSSINPFASSSSAILKLISCPVSSDAVHYVFLCRGEGAATRRQHVGFRRLSSSSSETQGQIVGARESLNGRENMARRKVKNVYFSSCHIFPPV